MRLSDDDLDRIGDKVKLIVGEAVKPLEEQLTRHDVLLRGANGDNGVCGNIADLKKRMRFVERVTYTWNTVLTIGAGFLGLHK